MTDTNFSTRTGAPRRRWIASMIAVVAAVALVGCSSGDDDSQPPSAVATASATAAATATASPTASASASASPTTATSAPTADGTPIRITVAGQTITATLNDSAVSQDFVKSLPVTLPWFRNAGIEYITELNAPMTETGPFYTDVEAGDIVYYNPLDSITIIYAPTSSVPTLTKMGEITSDLSVFEGLPDKVNMTIERA